jgi:hypothetical protein
VAVVLEFGKIDPRRLETPPKIPPSLLEDVVAGASVERGARLDEERVASESLEVEIVGTSVEERSVGAGSALVLDWDVDEEREEETGDSLTSADEEGDAEEESDWVEEAFDLEGEEEEVTSSALEEEGEAEGTSVLLVGVALLLLESVDRDPNICVN